MSTRMIPPPPSCHLATRATTVPAIILITFAAGADAVADAAAPATQPSDAVVASFWAVFLIGVGILGFLAYVVFGRLSEATAREASISVETHWGGFGGGMAGWRASWPIVWVIALIVILGTLGAFLLKSLDRLLVLNPGATNAATVTPAPASVNKESTADHAAPNTHDKAAKSGAAAPDTQPASAPAKDASSSH